MDLPDRPTPDRPINVGPGDDTADLPPAEAQAFLNERLAGLRLALKVRCIGIAAIWLFLVLLWPSPFILWNTLNLAALLVSGLVQFRALGRNGQYRLLYIGVLFDALLITAMLLVPDPWIQADAFTPQMVLNLAPVAVFMVLLVQAVASYDPRLVVWTSIVSTLSWVGGIVVLWTLPDTVTTVFEEDWTWRLNDAEDIIVGHPHFVNVELQLVNAFIILISGLGLAAIVQRARHMVRQAAAMGHQRANLARYLSPNLVESLAKRAEGVGAPRDAMVGVLFTDVIGFASLSQDRPPTEVMTLLRHLHRHLEPVVLEQGGTLDKYLGDGIMATFGTPLPTQADAANTLIAARKAVAAAELMNLDNAAAGRPLLPVSVGAHWGGAVVGDVGAENRLEFTVIGDMVNVASRLEHLTRPLGASLVISDTLLQAAKAQGAPAWAFEGLETAPPQEVKGRSGAIRVWRLPRTNFGIPKS